MLSATGPNLSKQSLDFGGTFNAGQWRTEVVNHFLLLVLPKEAREDKRFGLLQYWGKWSSFWVTMLNWDHPKWHKHLLGMIFLVLATLRSRWDLSPPIRDQTWAPCSWNSEFQPLNHEGSLCTTYDELHPLSFYFLIHKTKHIIGPTAYRAAEGTK